jgi:four helix bundle protein
MKDEGPEDEGPEDLRERTKAFALAAIRLFIRLPRTAEAQVLGRQFLKAGTSPGAQYREAQRAKSDADMVSKIEGAIQELEEADYWLDLRTESGVCIRAETQPLRTEANELIAIFTRIVLKVKARGTCR